MNNFTYNAAKTTITKKLYRTPEQMNQMLQIFAMSGDLTPEQYTELKGLLDAQLAETPEGE